MLAPGGSRSGTEADYGRRVADACRVGVSLNGVIGRVLAGLSIQPIRGAFKVAKALIVEGG